MTRAASCSSVLTSLSALSRRRPSATVVARRICPNGKVGGVLAALEGPVGYYRCPYGCGHECITPLIVEAWIDAFESRSRRTPNDLVPHTSSLCAIPYIVVDAARRVVPPNRYWCA
jgi:hypothetical protein